MNKIVKYVNVFLMLSALTGIIFEIIVANSLIKPFNYYTLQSNLIIVLITGLYILKDSKGQEKLYIWHLGTTSWILITGVVYHFMLSAIHNPVGLDQISNILLHYVTPIGMFFNWLLLTKNKLLSYKSSIITLVFPFIYVTGSMIRGYFTGFYPYWFMNPIEKAPDGVGSYPAAFRMISLLFISFFIVGFIMVFVNNLIAKKRND
ncbi:MAG: Pr6Pr family membrane protein [bacterium]